jgi:hypothetical protein
MMLQRVRIPPSPPEKYMYHVQFISNKNRYRRTPRFILPLGFRSLAFIEKAVRGNRLPVDKGLRSHKQCRTLQSRQNKRRTS